MDAAGARVERINVTCVAADEDSAVENRLPVKGSRTGESERPLELQPRHLARRQAGAFCRLEPGIGEIAPAIPGWRVHISYGRMSAAGVGHVLHVAGILFIQLPAAHVFGEQTFVRIGERRRVLFHRPCGDSGVDALGRHLFDGGLGRSMLHRRDTVTFCAVVLEQVDAGAFGQPLRKQARRGQQDQRQESTRDSI